VELDLDRRIAAIAALDQPVRRRLYRHLAASDGWTSRDDAADALDVARSVAAFHLDKLAEAGVVDVRFDRIGGRTGPGAGRPAKLYRLAADEVAASVPERRYDVAGALLATAVAASEETGQPVAECLHLAARAAGRVLGATGGDDLLGLLADHGYQPTVDGDVVVLTNCPFHRLVAEHRPLVCAMNLDYLTGVLDGIGQADRLAARLEPAPGLCCVRLAKAGPPAPRTE
jgi:predicted ArsR family transcriptional regulator